MFGGEKGRDESTLGSGLHSQEDGVALDPVTGQVGSGLLRTREFEILSGGLWVKDALSTGGSIIGRI